MELSAPKKFTWILGLVLGLLSLLAYFVNIPFVTRYLYWFMGAGWLLLVLGTFLKGL